MQITTAWLEVNDVIHASSLFHLVNPSVLRSFFVFHFVSLFSFLSLSSIISHIFLLPFSSFRSASFSFFHTFFLLLAFLLASPFPFSAITSSFPPSHVGLQAGSTLQQYERLTTRWYANLFHCHVTKERRVVTLVLFLDLVSVCRNRWLATVSRSSALLPVVACSSSSSSSSSRHLNININMVTCQHQRAANLT